MESSPIWQVAPQTDNEGNAKTIEATLNGVQNYILTLVGIARMVYIATGKINKDTGALPEELRQNLVLEIVRHYTEN